MSKRRIITKELAEKIADKLGAKIAKDGAHYRAEIFHNDLLVAWFGIRHGSEKDAGHDHISSQIFLNAHRAKLLGQCPLTKKQWIAIAKEKGMILESSDDPSCG